MSYNMFGWNALHDPAKTEHMYTIIRTFGPDILGCQEVEGFEYEIAENIGNDYMVAGGLSGEHAILYRSSVFDLEGYGDENIEEHDKWGQRTVEFAQLTHKKSGSLVDHFNTHFCTCDDEGQCCGEEYAYGSAKTVEAVIERYRRTGSKVVLTGDLNVFGGFENHKAIKYFKGELSGDIPPVVLDDTFRTANGPDIDGTTYPNSGKIDYVFASQGSSVESAYVDRHNYGPASDHWPISAVIDV